MSSDAGRYWLWFPSRYDNGKPRETPVWDRRGSFHSKNAAKQYQRWWLSNGQPRPTRILIDGETPQGDAPYPTNG